MHIPHHPVLRGANEGGQIATVFNMIPMEILIKNPVIWFSIWKEQLGQAAHMYSHWVWKQSSVSMILEGGNGEEKEMQAINPLK